MRRASFRWFAGVLLASGAGVIPRSVVAQAEVAAPAAATPAGDAVPPAERDVAAELYDLAFEALAQGEREVALRMLLELEHAHPEHRLAAQAAELIAVLQLPAKAEAPAALPPSAAAGPEPSPAERPAVSEREPASTQRHTTSARAELVAFQTLHGFAVGAELCVIAECEDARPWAITLMATTGSALGASLYLTREGVTPGLARALTTGTEWGLWHGLALGIATRAFETAQDESEASALGALLGQLGGLGVGGLVYSQLEPTAGQVSLASSGGIWSIASVGLGIALVDPQDITEQGVFTALLIAGDLGLAAGGYFASKHPMSAGRTLLIDAGGLLGGLTGAGVVALFTSNDVDTQVVAGVALAGLWTGLGLSYYLTSDWDSGDDEHAATAPRLSLGALPVRGGGLATAQLVF